MKKLSKEVKACTRKQAITLLEKILEDEILNGDEMYIFGGRLYKINRQKIKEYLKNLVSLQDYDKSVFRLLNNWGL